MVRRAERARPWHLTQLAVSLPSDQTSNLVILVVAGPGVDAIFPSKTDGMNQSLRAVNRMLAAPALAYPVVERIRSSTPSSLAYLSRWGRRRTASLRPFNVRGTCGDADLDGLARRVIE